MHAKNEQGGGAQKACANAYAPASAAFRAFVAVILCMGLMIPMTLSSGKAYAATGSGWDEYVKIREQVLPDYNHGTIQISSEAAQDNVIELKVGETATITVTPYQHVQYEGCRMWNKPCPTVCDEMFEEYGMEGTCFEKGKGCICTKTPSLETAEVSASSTKEDVASVSAVVADSSLSASSGVGKTNTGSVTIEAKAEGETEVTVGVDGLYFWYPAEQTYTVTVASDEGPDPTPSGDPALVDGAYQLDSAADLQWFADKVNAGEYGLNATLTDNIVLEDGVLPTIGDSTAAKAYKGTFDGAGFSITGITSLTGNQTMYAALFGGLAEGALVENLTLKGSVTNDTAFYVAPFAFKLFGGRIVNCANDVDVTAKGVSGFVYQAVGTTASSIESCINKADLTATDATYYLSGIVARANDNPNSVVEITKCGNEGALSGTCRTGGLVGYVYDEVKISDSYNKGVVSSSVLARGVGGLVGETAASKAGVSLSNSYNAGAVSVSGSTAVVGGLLGKGNVNTMSSCFNSGTVSVTEDFAGAQGSVVGTISSNSYANLSNVFYVVGSCENAVGGSVQPSESPLSKSADEMLTLASSLGSAFKDGAVSGHPILTWEPDEASLPAGASIVADQSKQLRQSSATGTVYADMENATAAWKEAVTKVSVKAVDGSDAGTVTVLDPSQYSIDAEKGRITFTRTDEAPVFSVALGEGEPYTETNRWGETITYPQSKNYEITIEAEGFAPTVGTVLFYTGGNDVFQVIVDADGDKDTSDDRTVVKEYTREDIEEMAEFHNGSSQCGMTGFRTFSGMGVPVRTLLEQAGVTVGTTDAFEIDVTDHYGVNTHNYSSLLGGDRYFFQSIYDDQEVKDTYAQLVQSDDQAGATVELRKILAEKALEDGSTVEPMIAVNYAETMLSGDEVADAVLPTEDNTEMSELVGVENSFRFIYGIKVVQEDKTVTFDAGDDATEVASQTVKSNPMSSTENTTMSSSYWANSIIVYRNAGYEDEPLQGADKLAKPTDPEREGFAFEGWYTKDGSQDGDWGEAFDFEANNGTVDSDVTLYAKWTAASDFDLGLTVDMGTEGYETVATDMGRSPAGKVDFKLRPTSEALAEYQKTHSGATTKDMLTDWIGSVTKVTIDGVELTGKAFDEWKSELTNPTDDADKLLYYDLSALSSYASIKLPVALFETNHSDKQRDTKTVTIEAKGFATFTGDVTYRNIGADEFTVRVLDSQGNVTYTTTLSNDQLKSLTVQNQYETSANCGMAGLRSYSSQGVLLSDVLSEAGVNFGPGMTLKLRCSDQIEQNGTSETTEDAYIGNGTFTYEEIMADRYHYPAMWDNTTKYDELDGKTIYEVLSQDKDAWKTGGQYADFLSKKLGETKEKVEPLIGFQWSEGVVAWGGSDPSQAGGYSGYCDQENYRFLFGLLAGENGEAIDDNTTFSNTYALFGVDIVADGGAVVPDPDPEEPTVNVDTESPDGSVSVTISNVEQGWIDAQKAVILNGTVLDSSLYSFSVLSDYGVDDLKTTLLTISPNAFGSFTGTRDFELKIAADGFEEVVTTFSLTKEQVVDPGTDDPSTSDPSQQVKDRPSGSTKAPATGDSMPVVPVACVAGAALLLLLVCALMQRRRSSGQKR